MSILSVSSPFAGPYWIKKVKLALTRKWSKMSRPLLAFLWTGSTRTCTGLTSAPKPYRFPTSTEPSRRFCLIVVSKSQRPSPWIHCRGERLTWSAGLFGFHLQCCAGSHVILVLPAVSSTGLTGVNLPRLRSLVWMEWTDRFWLHQTSSGQMESPWVGKPSAAVAPCSPQCCKFLRH